MTRVGPLGTGRLRILRSGLDAARLRSKSSPTKFALVLIAQSLLLTSLLPGCSILQASTHTSAANPRLRPAASAWPAAMHDAMRTGRSQYRGPRRPRLKWDFDSKSQIMSGLAVGPDGTVYFGTISEQLFAVGPDGTKKWDFKAPGEVVGTPALAADGTIYFGSAALRGGNKFYALSPDGAMKWAFETDAPIVGSPAIGPDGTIYFGSAEVLHALAPDGGGKWTFPAAGQINSSPAIARDGTIYVGTDPSAYTEESGRDVNGKLYALRRDGQQKWAANLDGGVRSDPSIGPDGTVYVCSTVLKEDYPVRASLYALRPDGAAKWVRRGYASRSIAVSRDGTLYASRAAVRADGSEPSDPALHALSRSGLKKWESSDLGSVGTPAIGRDGTLYSVCSIVSPEGELVRGKLRALRPNGDVLWELRVPAASSPAIGSDGTIYVAGERKVFAIGDRSRSGVVYNIPKRAVARPVSAKREGAAAPLVSR